MIWAARLAPFAILIYFLRFTFFCEDIQNKHWLYVASGKFTSKDKAEFLLNISNLGYKCREEFTKNCIQESSNIKKTKNVWKVTGRAVGVSSVL